MLSSCCNLLGDGEILDRTGEHALAALAIGVFIPIRIVELIVRTFVEHTESRCYLDCKGLKASALRALHTLQTVGVRHWLLPSARPRNGRARIREPHRKSDAYYLPHGRGCRNAASP